MTICSHAEVALKSDWDLAAVAMTMYPTTTARSSGRTRRERASSTTATTTAASSPAPAGPPGHGTTAPGTAAARSATVTSQPTAGPASQAHPCAAGIARRQALADVAEARGFTAAEVCLILGISAANQRVLLHRARAFVREELDRYFSVDPEQKLL